MERGIRPNFCRAALAENVGLAFGGVKIYGQGFLVGPDEHRALCAKNKSNGERLFPYVGGEEVNTSPTQEFERFVIHLSEFTLEEAARWPDLLRIVEERVRPERESRDHNAIARRQKAYWWKFRSDNPNLYGAIRNLPRCLVTSQVSKHLVFSFQPTDRVFSQKLIVFPFDDYARFAVMQSRVHAAWVWLLSSTMKSDLNYSPSDAFETFPFPPNGTVASLEGSGRALYETRARYMVDENVGLTIAYNRMKDPVAKDAPIEELRALTVAMDREVLAAYGWSDLESPAFTSPTTDDAKRGLSLFEDTVIDRLFALNAGRDKAEGGAGGRASNTDDDEAAARDTDAPAESGRTAKMKTFGASKKKKPA